MDPSRVAVVTGASQGIGAGLVAGYRSLGYAVVATSRSIRPGDDPMVLAVPADVSRPGAGDRIVGAALERFGRVDTLVNNAGLFVGKPFAEYTDDDYDQVTAVNLRGFFEVTRRAVPATLAALTKGGVAAATRALPGVGALRHRRDPARRRGPERRPLKTCAVM